MRMIQLFAAALAIGAAFSGTVKAEVRVPSVFSDHAVLQRETAVAVWGTASAGEKVIVKFREQEKAAEADKDGNWMVRLDPLKPGGPDVLTINSLKFQDVLVGDVWLGSGQSNMAGSVAHFAENDPLLKNLAAEAHANIRLLNSPGQPWRKSTPEGNASMSALLFSFGVSLQKEIGVPVGLMVGAVGGTQSGKWLSPEMLLANEACQREMAAFAAANPVEKQRAEYEKNLAKWQKDVELAKRGQNIAVRKPQVPVQPGVAPLGVGDLYAKHIRPLVPYAIKGVLWDQGEGGTGLMGVEQPALMGALTQGWRRAFGQRELPFLYVQKPSGGGCAWDYTDPVTKNADAFKPLPAEAPDREEGNRRLFVQMMSIPNAFMVIATDLGSGTHPVNKFGYGARAARVAMGAVYKKQIEYYGPVYASHKAEGSKLRVSFTHVGQGLAFKNGEKLQGFAIAGQDRKWVWADATIDGDTVVLSSDKVATPIAVRYAWSGHMAWANLFNKDGLPAVSFKTDEW